MDVAAWLRNLGLERYAPAFRDHAVDAEVLPRLTAEDLAALGVSAVGHRRRLLDAIATLRQDDDDDDDDASGAAAGAGAPRRAAGSGVGAEGEAGPGGAAMALRSPGAERRQLTVLFCDLVGSTELAGRLDPEDLREVVGAYHRRAAEVVARFDGHVASYLGDGVLAYFGFPRAHEDDAERAVRAGLELVGAVAALRTRDGAALRARVGIATGVVVVGDLLAGGPGEKAAVGETPNLAARLQALAEPGTVVIGAGTRRLVLGVFDVLDLGAHGLKGFAEPVRAWRVLGPSAVEVRFEARATAAGLTPLVGREGELALLLRRFEQARAGAGQVVLLAGEAGVGKSRLVRALGERLGGGVHAVVRCQCSPYHVSSALYPVIAHLERAAGFERDDAPGAKLAKLEALLARWSGVDDGGATGAVPLLAGLLSIPAAAGCSPPPDLTPERRRRLTLAALVDRLAALARREPPVLLVLEDAHWIDPSTEELFGLVVERVRDLPVLAVATFRPGYAPPWQGGGRHGHVTALALNRLDRRQAAAMVGRVAAAAGAGAPLPARVVERIVAKADGVPLFVEELTKAVLEAGAPPSPPPAPPGGEAAGDCSSPEGSTVPPLAVPATLHDSLMARLDRLPAAREVAQVGAVIGREFGYELLAAVAPTPEPALGEALAALVAAGLVSRRGGATPRATYAFKHALVRDAAYHSLLISRRRRLHARIVEALEARFPATAEADPELLARHCAEAGLVDKAVAYWNRAGRRSLARSAPAEAAAQLERGLELLAGLAPGPGRRRRELDLQVALGRALAGAKGFAAPATGRAFARARELCREAGDVDRLFPVLNGLAVFHNTRGEQEAAHAVAAEMLALARRGAADGDGPGGDAAAVLIPAHRAMSLTSLQLGRFAAARRHAEEALALYDPARHRALAARYAFDQRVVALGYLAWALLVQGYPEQARRRNAEAVAEARELAQPYTLAQALHFACILHRTLGEAEPFERRAEALAAVATEHGLSFFLANGRLNRGWALMQRGRAAEGLAEIERGAAVIRDMGARLLLPYVTGLLADACALAGRRQEALAWGAEARAWTEQGANPWFEADLHRRNGELLLALSGPDRAAEAEACFRRAVEVARRQDAPMWELRAASSLARLWRDRGRRAEARALLAPAYGRFTEGFDVQDLKDAKALLDDLG